MGHRGTGKEAEERAEGEGCSSAEGYVARHKADPLVVVVVSVSLISSPSRTPCKDEGKLRWKEKMDLIILTNFDNPVCMHENHKYKEELTHRLPT